MKPNSLHAQEILNAHHIRMTPQRLCVYSTLATSNTHLSAEDVYKRIQKAMPAVSLATVYSILECFKKAGLVKEIRIDPERSFYETRRDGHHHFLCRKCGRIFDIDIDPCPTIKRMKVDGHSIEELHGYFYGICRDCL